MDEIVEVVLMRARDGVTDGQIIAAGDTLQRDLEGLEAYVSRRLLKTDDGQWIDEVEWTSLEAAMGCAEEVMALPSAAAFMELVDMSTVTMLHLRKQRVYAGSRERATS